MESHYKHHIFICNNRRPPGARTCCADKGADAARDHAKRRVAQLKLNRPGAVRVNQAGCMERCEQGPCLVIYPEAVWYTFHSERDIDEIIEEHVVNGRPVERLRLK